MRNSRSEGGPAPSPLAGEGGGEGSAARQRGEMEPHAPIGSAAPQRAATAGASAAGSCFDRDARIPRRAPTPPSRRNTRRLLLLTRGHPTGPLRPTHPPRILLSCGGCFDRTRGYLAAPPCPRPNDGASLASLLPAPPRVAREPDCPRWPRWGRGAPHPALSLALSLVCGGLRPPHPIPEERALRAAPAHPPALGCSFCGGRAPTPPPGSPAGRRETVRRPLPGVRGPDRRSGAGQGKTTVWLPCTRMRFSMCQRTARASTTRSISRPRRIRSARVSRCETRATSCSMIGPSSRSSVA